MRVRIAMISPPHQYISSHHVARRRTFKIRIALESLNMGFQKSDGDSRSLLSSLGEFWAMRMAIGCSIRGGVYYLLERYFSLDDLFISYLFFINISYLFRAAHTLIF